MKSEDLLKVFKYSGVELINTDFFCTLDASNDIIRWFDFQHGGHLYSIEWFVNESKLVTNGMSVMFEEVRFSGIWPNRYKNSLQFYMNDRVIAVIGIEEYPDN